MLLSSSNATHKAPRSVKEARQLILERTGVRRGEPVREDEMNLLRTMRDNGLKGVRPALESGKFLPSLVGALAGSALLGQHVAQQAEQPQQ